MLLGNLLDGEPACPESVVDLGVGRDELRVLDTHRLLDADIEVDPPQHVGCNGNPGVRNRGHILVAYILECISQLVDGWRVAIKVHREVCIASHAAESRSERSKGV